jgi:8-oxo-dGTP diphosphatase
MSIHATPRLTVDPVVFVFRENKLRILLAKRTNDPEKGAWSIPGGHVAPNQTLLGAIELSLSTKSGVGIQSLGYIEQLYAFDTLGLDPRGHAITIAFLCLSSQSTIKNPNLPGNPEFIDIASLPQLAFDHLSIVHKGMDQLKELLLKTTAAVYLLPRYFTMADLHNLYEAALGKRLDRRNFRKKMLSLGVLDDSGNKQQGVANRPGLLYTFKSHKQNDLIKPLYF